MGRAKDSELKSLVYPITYPSVTYREGEGFGYNIFGFPNNGQGEAFGYNILGLPNNGQGEGFGYNIFGFPDNGQGEAFGYNIFGFPDNISPECFAPTPDFHVSINPSPR